jgi:hypothetical protein
MLKEKYLEQDFPLVVFICLKDRDWFSVPE